jgi:hypothetical protein
MNVRRNKYKEWEEEEGEKLPKMKKEMKGINLPYLE